MKSQMGVAKTDFRNSPDCRKSYATRKAPSDEGAVSGADWGRDNRKHSEFWVNTDKTETFSLPQSNCPKMAIRQLPHQREPWALLR